MKKYLFFIFFALCTLSPVLADNTNNSGSNGSSGDDKKEHYGDDEVSIRDLTTSTNKPQPIPRSGMATAAVQAWVDLDFNQLEVVFNDSVGVATVTVESMGVVVAGVRCDTSMQDAVYLTIPSTPGYYIIRIVSSVYQGEGEYVIAE